MVSEGAGTLLLIGHRTARRSSMVRVPGGKGNLQAPARGQAAKRLMAHEGSTPEMRQGLGVHGGAQRPPAKEVFAMRKHTLHISGSPHNSHISGSPHNSHISGSPHNSHISGSPHNSQVPQRGAQRHTAVHRTSRTRRFRCRV